MWVNGLKNIRWTAGLFCLVLVVALGLTGCQEKKKKKVVVTEEPNSNITYIKGPDFVGVIKNIDAKNQRIVFYNTLMEVDEEYSYSGATSIYSKNDRDMTMAELSVGEVFDVTNSQDGTKVTEMKESSDIIVEEDVTIAVNADEGRLSIDDVNYAYSEHLIAISDGKAIDPMEITDSDRVTFRGIKGQAYSVVVTRGHGYIEPTNYKDFVGGKLTVEGEAILPVSSGMLLTVPEGSQIVSLINGDLTAKATVEVKRGQVTKLNVAKYQSQMPDTSRVTFDISPEGAELYINGNLTDYSKPVSMKYGNHSVKVVLEGYQDYSGVVKVKDSSAKVRINLAEETAEVASDEGSNSSSVETDNSSDSSKQTKYDSDRTITVSAPEGAAVYIDGTFKGTVPCSFTKVLGSVTLTLTKEGYTTKSYSVEIPDDSQDISWSFPDLSKSSKG